jgi:hypothetical protein
MSDTARERIGRLYHGAAEVFTYQLRELLTEMLERIEKLEEQFVKQKEEKNEE